MAVHGARRLSSADFDRIDTIAADFAKVEHIARRTEELVFAGFVRVASHRIRLLLEADRPVEAHQQACGLNEAAERRLVQLEAAA